MSKSSKLVALAFAVVLAVGAVSCKNGSDKENVSDNNNSADWVDLGLPSGLLWATHNVGATTPEEYGHHLAWGETQAKATYGWETYAFGDSKTTLTRYCGSAENGLDGFTDNLATLQPSDDAATANWGDDARTPTKEDWDELLDNCTREWVTQNNVSGYKLTGTNGNTIFLPAAGYCLGDELIYADSCGTYCSASLYTDSPYDAWYFAFRSDTAGVYYGYRSCGMSVRPVRSAQ